jgi:hypothetical protein
MSLIKFYRVACESCGSHPSGTDISSDAARRRARSLGFKRLPHPDSFRSYGADAAKRDYCGGCARIVQDTLNLIKAGVA